MEERLNARIDRFEDRVDNRFLMLDTQNKEIIERVTRRETLQGVGRANTRGAVRFENWVVRPTGNLAVTDSASQKQPHARPAGVPEDYGRVALTGWDGTALQFGARVIVESETVDGRKKLMVGRLFPHDEG